MPHVCMQSRACATLPNPANAARAGGDWGSAVVTALGGAHSNHCRAIYMNGCFAGPEFTNPLHVAQLLNAKLPLANWFPVFISFQEMAGLRATQAFIDKETGAHRRTAWPVCASTTTAYIGIEALILHQVKLTCGSA